MRRSLPVLALAAALFLAGCDTPSNDPAASPSTAASPSPTADSRDSVTVVKESFARAFEAKTFAMTATISAGPQQSVDMTASADLAAESMRLTMGGPVDMEMVKLGKELFIKAPDLGSKPWVRLDVDKLNSTSSLRQSLDLTQHSGILGGVVTAEKRDSAAGTVTYEGTADLKKAVEAAPDGAKAQMEPVSRLAKNATAVPYKATIDDQGRLTELSYTVELAQGEMLSEIKLADLGKPVTIAKPPAADVADATEEQYAFF
ncbi:hypothetical protein [Asanoa siamensis]|uniref:Lipoprotein LprG n=1 Tax=Asanoa siamensis TaxID=926357 RepID=A0ABQ4CXM7_9ACTN|nr:hypothetical protein [Asanoa siamensis]GIF76052.1 hypothetical protein Asi02nite_55700 [Asanoa siamensis]